MKAQIAQVVMEDCGLHNGNNNNNNKNKNKNQQKHQQQQHRAGGAEVGACTASPRPVDTGACEKGVREDDSCKGGVSRGRGASGEGPGSIVGGVVVVFAILGGAEIKALRAGAIINQLIQLRRPTARRYVGPETNKLIDN